MTNHLKIIFLFMLAYNNLLAQNADHKQSSNVKLNAITNTFNNFGIVEKDKLYRSRQLSAKVLQAYIDKYKIRSIINLRGVNNKKWYTDEARVAKENNIALYNIPMRSRYLPSRENLLRLFWLYDHAQKPILVHCRGGADRSGEAAALWAIEKQKKSKKEAMKQLSLRYFYFFVKKPAKAFLIKIWNGTDWLKTAYDPKNYPKYYYAPKKELAYNKHNNQTIRT